MKKANTRHTDLETPARQCTIILVFYKASLIKLTPCPKNLAMSNPSRSYPGTCKQKGISVLG